MVPFPWSLLLIILFCYKDQTHSEGLLLDMGSLIGTMIFVGSTLIIIGAVWCFGQISSFTASENVVLKTNTILREHGGDAVSKAVGYATNTDPTAQQHLNDIARQFDPRTRSKVMSHRLVM